MISLIEFTLLIGVAAFWTFIAGAILLDLAKAGHTSVEGVIWSRRGTVFGLALLAVTIAGLVKAALA